MSPLPRRSSLGSPLLRDDDAVPPERLRPDRREPRRATDQDRGKPCAPLDPRGLELARPGVGARPLRSRPLAIDHAERRAKVLERFRDGLGAAVQGSCRGWRRRPCGPLRVLLLADPGAPGHPSSAPAIRRLQWATYDAVSDENRLAGLRSATGRDVDLMLRLDRASVILCPRRRSAAHRSGDDPSRARLRGRKACGSLRWRDEPALRR